MIILPESAIDRNNPRMGWQNRVTRTGLNATSAAEGYPVTNLANPATFLRWRAAGLDSQTITVALGGSFTVDYIGIARHNFATAGVSYTIQGSPDGVNWTNLAATATPATDAVIMHEFPPATVQAVRVVLSAADIEPEVAVLHVGSMLVSQRRLYVGHSPINYGRQTTVSTGYSESGQFLGRVRRRQFVAATITLPNLTPQWYRESFEPMLAMVDVHPFFWAWRPEQYPNEVAYVWATEDPRVSNQRANGMMQVEIPIQGVLS